MSDRRYGGSKATSSTGGVGKARSNAGGSQWPNHGIDGIANGQSTPQSHPNASYRSNDTAKRAASEAWNGESGHEYPNKKKTPMGGYERHMPGHPSVSGLPNVPMQASTAPYPHFTSPQGSTVPISGAPHPSLLRPNGGPLHHLPPHHATHGLPHTAPPYAPVMHFYSMPTANGEYVDPLAAPKELTVAKKVSSSASAKPVTTSSSTLPAKSSFMELGMTSLLPPSKLAAAINNAPDSSSAADGPKEYGSVAFSFEKSTKPAFVPQSLLAKSKLVSTPASAPVLPPSAATSSVHKPGAHIAFFKPVVVPKRTGLVSSYRARRDDEEEDEEAPPPAPAESVEPEKPAVNEHSTSQPSSQPNTTNSIQGTSNSASQISIGSEPASSAPSSTTQVKLPDSARRPPASGMRNLDSYKIVELISEGSYGVVYKAIDSVTGEMVALKKVKVDPMKEKDTGFPVSSIREIKALGFLRNETIVNLRDVISDASGAVVYLVMDYVPHDLHQKLKHHLKKARPTLTQSGSSSGPTGSSPATPTPIEPLFSVANSKSLMFQLLESMAFLHSKNYMHRDIKSANLLVSDEGKLYLADFGLTKEWTTTGQRQRTPTVVTITYRAPELAFGAPDYTTAIDMWSVGLVMCELITGKELMRGVKNEIELMSKLVEIFGTPNESNFGRGYTQLSVNQPNSALALKPQPENKLRNFVPNLSRQGFDLLSRLLCYDPDKRITADQALLHPWFKELPMPARPYLGPPPPAPNPTPPPTQLAPLPPQQHYPPPHQPYTNQRPPQEPYYAYGGRAPDRYPPHHGGPPVPYHDPYYAPQHAAPPPYGRFQQDPRRSHRGRPEYR